MKKLLVIFACLMMLFGCATEKEDEKKEDALKVGVLQLLTHDALDSAYEGFVDYFKSQGIELVDGTNLVYQNPQADQATLVTMADSLINADCDVILAIATSPVAALKNANIDTPIVGTAITDFVDAGLVDSNEKPGGLVTGVSDNCDMNVQLNLALEIVPELKTLGIIYASSEVNSDIQAKQMKAACEAKGIAVEIATVSDATEIDTNMQTLVKKVDAIYVPTDNIIASAMSSVVLVCEENKVPVINSEKGQVEAGGLVSLGCDYFKLGQQAGKMALEIINGADPATMPIEFQEEFSIFYNSAAAERMGVTLSERIITEGIDVAK